MKNDVLKNFVNFTGKTLYWFLFSIKFQALRPATLLKSDPNKCFFPFKLTKFLIAFTLINIANGCFYIVSLRGKYMFFRKRRT